MPNIVRETKKTTTTQFDRFGNVMGRIQVVEESEREELIVPNNELDGGCLCDDCEADENGCPSSCMCDTDCINGNECTDRCYADLPDCSEIDESAASIGDCDSCPIGSNCASNALNGDTEKKDDADEEAKRFAETLFRHISRELGNEKVVPVDTKVLSTYGLKVHEELQKLIDTKSQDTPKPQMVIIAGKGLESINGILDTLGVNK